ncbi:MAG TPA: response regulator [Chroococcidiopsis sp.]
MYKVLIVDDDPAIREATKISIEIVAGWKTLLAASGQEGLFIAQEKQPDAILLDVMMPEMDGLMTLQCLQANPVTQPIPVILFTSLTQNTEHKKFSQLPISGVILKPFDAIDLVGQMRTLLNWH